MRPRKPQAGGLAPVDRAPAADTETPYKPAVPALRFDWADWLPYLEDEDIPEEQKRALIETLWSIVVAFVDLGWQLNPKPEICGEVIDLKAVLTATDVGKGEDAA